MLSRATKIGRYRISQPFSLKNIKNKLEHSCQLSTSKGYVTKNSIIRYRNKIENKFCHLTINQYSSTENPTESLHQDLDLVQFEKITDDTLESLTEYFDELVEKAEHLKDADVIYGSGVLTVKFGDEYGTYVINRQTPNKQIWLSSPTSGPKRYDFIGGKWIYKHDGRSLHQLLNDEIPLIIRNTALFDKCAYSGKIK